MPLQFHMSGWNEVVKDVVDNQAMPMARRIAAASNAEMGDVQTYSNIGEHFKASVEGDARLALSDYHATVITATQYAMRANAKHNILTRNMSAAG